MKFPIDLSFKIVSISSRLYARDADGNGVCFVKQKKFKLREHVEVFRDDSREELLCNIKTNKILDFSAAYNFTKPDGTNVGGIQRKGMRSIFKAHYQILDPNGEIKMEINEENGWIKVLDGFVGGIPVVGMMAGYFLNPSYLITKDGTPIVRIKKQPAFWEGKFQIQKLEDFPEQDEDLIMYSIIMMTLLERSRG